MDAFAVAIAVGLTLPQVTARHVFRLAWHFGLFQFLMPVVGWSAGRHVSAHVAGGGHWVAFGLLSVIGGKMLYEGLRADGTKKAKADPTRGWTLLTLSVATSIDALAVGLSIGFLGTSIWTPAAVIGIVAAALTGVGITFGSKLGVRWERRAQVVGAVVLLAIGVRILVSHVS